QLLEALDRYGLLDRVQLHVVDSKLAELPAASIDLLFIDGDHRQEAVRADLDHWAPALRRGGHLLFHDAVDASDFVSPCVLGPATVAEEVGDDFERSEGAGSLAHFVRRG